jgi:hypothetical protein
MTTDNITMACFGKAKHQVLLQQLLPLLFWMVIICVLLQPVQSSCEAEFGKCVMNRDCCEGLSCVAGDWQFTTDSTCLSPKSARIEERGFSKEEKERIVTQFYHKQGVLDKTPAQIEHLVKKYGRKFHQLVARLEKKYGIVMDIFPDDVGTAAKEEF